MFAKILNGGLVLKVSSGYIDVNEFLRRYTDVERERVQEMVDRGEDPFEQD